MRDKFYRYDIMYAQVLLNMAVKWGWQLFVDFKVYFN